MRLRGSEIERRAARCWCRCSRRPSSRCGCPSRSTPASEPSSSIVDQLGVGPRVVTLGDLDAAAAAGDGLPPLVKMPETVSLVIVAYSAALYEPAPTISTITVVKAASHRVRARSSRSGRECMAVITIEAHHTNPTTTAPTTTHCRVPGRLTTERAELVSPLVSTTKARAPTPTTASASRTQPMRRLRVWVRPAPGTIVPRAVRPIARRKPDLRSSRSSSRFTGTSAARIGVGHGFLSSAGAHRPASTLCTQTVRMPHPTSGRGRCGPEGGSAPRTGRVGARFGWRHRAR